MESYTLFTHHLFDGVEYQEDVLISVSKGSIDRVDPNKPEYQVKADFVISDQLLIPGFIDLQVNGGGGVLFNNTPTLSGLKQILDAHQALGTHAIMPTLITADDTTTKKALFAVRDAISTGMDGILGIHLEGPMLNPKRRGIHNASLFRTLSPEMLELITQHNFGKVLITIAPEMIDPSLILELTNHGFYLFAGHTEATPEELSEAIAYGLHGFTHIFNAMPQMSSREPKATGFALSDTISYATIINDGLHIDPRMVLIASRAKAEGKLLFVSDSMASTGSTISSFTLDQKKIYLKGGRLVDDKETLAGAHLSLSDAVFNGIEIGIPKEKAIKMASRYPAEALNLQDRGKIATHYRANFNLLDLKRRMVTPFTTTRERDS